MPNVAVVVLDTLRLDTFCREFDWLSGRRFTRAYAPSHWTVPVHGSLFTGRYPSEIGVHGQSPSLDCPEPVLAEQLAAAGYRTRTFTANPQLKQYDGWDRGVDEFVTAASLDAYRPGDFDWGACFDDLSTTGARKYVDAVWRCLGTDCDRLRSLRQGLKLYRRSDADGGARSVLDRVRATTFDADREFLFVNLMETHTPYHPAEPGGDPVVVVAADAFADQPLDLDAVRAAYRASARYLSELYRELFAALMEEFDYVITLSDHGELLGEHGMVNHSFGLWPELTHVPLVVSGPDVESGVDHSVRSLLDVHRTVADLAGVDVDSRGRSLVEPAPSRDVLFEYHGLLPFHEAQFERKDVPTAEYERRSSPLEGYVAASGSYAHETHTRGFRTRGHFAGDPGERLDELVATLDRRSVESESLTVSGAVKSRLEDLGYA